VAAVPTVIQNRPGLSAVAYRIGTFATFRKAMLDKLAHTPALAGLTARVGDDYSITTIELWAAIADVLTFYQERTANEAFLRTSALRDSVLRLVRLIDYQLRPGAAATTQLVFALDAGAAALIPAQTRVQSVPAQGEQPQKFETLISIMADARLNKLRVFPRPQPGSPTGSGASEAIVAPDAEALLAAATLSPADRVMLYAPDASEVLTLRSVRSQDDLLILNWTLPIAGTSFTNAFTGNDQRYGAYRLGRSFHLFGFDAPATVVVAELKNTSDPTSAYLTSALTDFSLHGDGTQQNQFSLDARYAGLKPGAVVLAVGPTSSGNFAVPCLISSANEVQVQRSAKSSSGAVTVCQSGTVTQLTLPNQTFSNLLPDDIRNVVLYELLGPSLRFWPYHYADTLATSEVYLPGRRAGWSSIEVGRGIARGVAVPGTVLDVADLTIGRSVFVTDGRTGQPVTATVSGVSLVGSNVSLSATNADTLTIGNLGLAPAQVSPVTVIVSQPIAQPFNPPSASRCELTVTMGVLPPQTISLDKTTLASGTPASIAAALQTAIRAALPGAPTFARALAWTAYDSVIAVAAGLPGDRVAFGPSAADAATVAALGLDPPHAGFVDGILSVPIALPLASAISGNVSVTVGIDSPVDVPIDIPAGTSDAATLANTLVNQLLVAGGVTATATSDGRILVLPLRLPFEQRSFMRLSLQSDAPLDLDTWTAVLLGNVAPASHGETVRNEVVGDGDASQQFQHFALAKKPVTYVPGATPGGVSSSLQLLVDGVLWTEHASLYGASPRDRIYVTRIADDGTLTVQFGDGVTGARPPSGRQNLVASYRQGIGISGRVGAGKLTTLLDRPTGVKSATNLTAADGGADPETLDHAREAAPGTVRTFGRAVSLRDFEDTALMAGQVAKASATWVWTGERRAIHLTIAGQGGATFSLDGLKQIAATLGTERDPNHKLLVANYAPVPVLVDASIIVDDQYVATQVLLTAGAALLQALSFDSRRFAQPVYLSDIFRVLQEVEGVVAVDVNRLDLKSRDPALRAAHGIDDTLSGPQPRLLMLPARPAGAGTVLPAELALVESPAQDITLQASGGLSG
jgi:hypothetical protein